MIGDDNNQHGSGGPEVKHTKDISQTENVALRDADVQEQDPADARHLDGLAHDGTGDVNMKDGEAHDNIGAIEVDPEEKVVGEQSAQLEVPAAALHTQQTSEEQSPPASPRLTDALEAALDGLLGPVTEDKAPEAAALTDVKEGETPPQDGSQPDAAPIPEAVPAEGGDDANPEWEVDSSPYESSSSDSSDDSSDDDESDVEESKLGVEETARLLMAVDGGGSDDEMDGVRAAKQAAGVRTKNEQPDEPDPKPEIQIGPEDAIVPLGIVQHLVEGTQVVIEALRDGTAVTILDRGTVLCKEDRTILGVIHDTIATVHKPMYILKFKSDEEVKQASLERGAQIWYPKSHAKFVFPSQLRAEKGSDASNLHDEEVGPEEMEYSDDEQEQAHKREKKNRKRGKGKGNKGDDHESRAHIINGDSNLRYDDDNDDGPYKPLARPANFGMGLPPPPPPGVSAFPPTHGGRGGQHHNNRRGGDSRGRGGRGRGFNGRGRGGHGHNSHHQSPAPPQSPHQPPPPFAANPPPPMPGQWPFPIPPPPQFLGAIAPPNPSAPIPGFPMPNWGAAQSSPFPFPPAPPLPNWPNAVPRPPQQAGYPAPATAYGMPTPYTPNGVASPPAPAPNSYQYSNYYSGGGGGGGQAQNGQSQRWG